MLPAERRQFIGLRRIRSDGAEKRVPPISGRRTKQIEVAVKSELPRHISRVILFLDLRFLLVKSANCIHHLLQSTCRYPMINDLEEPPFLRCFPDLSNDLVAFSGILINPFEIYDRKTEVRFCRGCDVF